MAQSLAWSLDHLLRVSKIVGGEGAVFVSTSNPKTARGKAVVLRNPMESDTSVQSWQVVFTVEDGQKITYLMCGAYGDVGADPGADPPKQGTPTFVVAGRALDEDAGTAKEFILTSNDGNKWSKTRNGPGNEVYVMAWNDTQKKFYAQSRTDAVPEVSPDIYEVLSSADGFSWSVVDTHIRTVFDEIWASDLLQATGTDMIKDTNGNIVPNGGLFGFDKDRSTWIAPRTLVEVYSWYGHPDTPPLGNTVEIIKKIIDPETGSVTTTRTTRPVPIPFVMCVGCAGSIWQAGGYEQSGVNLLLRIATSIDDGDTWILAYPNNSLLAASCMLGAPASMF